MNFDVREPHEDEERLLENEDSEDDDAVEENFTKKQTNTTVDDPVIDAIGNFGLYQLGIAIVGLFQTIVHGWQSLCLKFVGMKTNFTCSHGVGGVDHCRAYWQNGTDTPCTDFTFDESTFSETIVQRWSLVCDNEEIGNIAQSVFFSGCLGGVFVSGLLADRYGRRPVLLWLVLVFILSGLWGSTTSSIYIWLISIFIRGATTIGSGTVRFVIQVELMGGKAKVWGNAIVSVGWVLGYMSLPILAYLVPNMARMEAVISLGNVPFLLLFLFYPESPRWLISAGRFEEARKVIVKAADWNKRESDKVTVNSLRKFAKSQQQSEGKSEGRLYDLLWLPGLRRNLLSMFVCWCAVGMSYFGLALHTPEFGSNVFLVFFIGGLMDVPSLVLGPTLLTYLGRRPCMTGGLLLGGVALLATSAIPKGVYYKEWPIITLAILGKMAVGVTFDCGYIFTSELFPTVVRNSVLSTASSGARLGAIVAPLVAEIDSSKPRLPLIVYGIVVLVAGLQSFLLWPETVDLKKLPDTLEEGEVLATRIKTLHVSASSLNAKLDSDEADEATD